MMTAVVSSAMKSRAALQLENVALRHQIGVLQRSAKKRLSLNQADRLFWIGLSRMWAEWRSVLKIVKPETVIAWHRNAFRKFWTWKVRRGRPGRPAVSADIRALIRRRSRENPGWGAPRIHGELLKLGIDIGETSVSKYLRTGGEYCRAEDSGDWHPHRPGFHDSKDDAAYREVGSGRFGCGISRGTDTVRGRAWCYA